MGGELFVGIRKSDGTEHCSLRWTNIMPLFMADPDFLNEGKSLDEFISRAKPTNKWPQSRLIKTIQSSEYGVVLIDFPSKQILSRQDYFKIGSFSVTSFSSAFIEELSILVKLYKLGWVKDLYNSPIPIETSKLSSSMKDECFNWVNEILTKKGERAHSTLDKFFTVIHADLNLPFEVNDSLNRACDVWPEVVKWVKDHNWITKIKGRKYDH